MKKLGNDFYTRLRRKQLALNFGIFMVKRNIGSRVEHEERHVIGGLEIGDGP